MDNVQIFKAYFDAFEETYADNNWDRIAPYFADDMVYNNAEGESLNGKEAAIAYLNASVDSSDRQFDSRAFDGEPEISGAGEQVTMVFTVRYRIEGAPDLVLSGKEIATFTEGKIQQLDDIFDDHALSELSGWMEKHAGLFS